MYKPFEKLLSSGHFVSRKYLIDLKVKNFEFSDNITCLDEEASSYNFFIYSVLLFH